MNNKRLENELPLPALKNEASRQRWEMFHRAIAHAKQSNFDALQEDDRLAADPGLDETLLYIVR